MESGLWRFASSCNGSIAISRSLTPPDGRSPEERCLVRRQKSRPLVEAFEAWLRAKLALVSQTATSSDIQVGPILFSNGSRRQLGLCDVVGVPVFSACSLGT